MPSLFRKNRAYEGQPARQAPSSPTSARSERAVKTLSRLSSCLCAIAVGAVVFAVVTASSAQTRLAAFEGSTETVCVANVAIPSGTLLEAEMFRTEEIPSAYVAEGALPSPESATGRITVAPIASNGQVTAESLAAEGNASSLANALEPGLRAISIAVDAESGLAGLIRQGDRVDALAEGNLVVENAAVLAVDSSLDEALHEYATVTLQVAPEDALALQAVQEQASVRLVMRAAADNAQEDAEMAEGQAEGKTEGSQMLEGGTA